MFIDSIKIVWDDPFISEGTEIVKTLPTMGGISVTQLAILLGIGLIIWWFYF
jgi:hypothetical protein